VSDKSITQQQAGLVIRAKTSRWSSADLAGACSSWKFVVSRAGGACDARNRGPNRKFVIRYLAGFTLVLTCLIQPALSVAQDSTSPPSEKALPGSKPDDFNRTIYYKNKLEFSFETGWLPINIPFVFDFLIGAPYGRTPLDYTLVPIFPSLRWHMGNIRGPSILRGNTDLTFTGSFTVIPRGPETRYGAYDMGLRRNFVQPNWRIVPYFEIRGGLGWINAKGPKGVPFAQGQDFTFTIMMGSGVRYNFSPRYGVSAGITYMHVSNAYLSQPRFTDYGINVYGPIVGIDIRF
jgi:hypothetical protein